MSRKIFTIHFIDTPIDLSGGWGVGGGGVYFWKEVDSSSFRSWMRSSPPHWPLCWPTFMRLERRKDVVERRWASWRFAVFPLFISPNGLFVDENHWSAVELRLNEKRPHPDPLPTPPTQSKTIKNNINSESNAHKIAPPLPQFWSSKPNSNRLIKSWLEPVAFYKKKKKGKSGSNRFLSRKEIRLEPVAF